MANLQVIPPGHGAKNRFTRIVPSRQSGDLSRLALTAC
jgi:hypothetical protein